MGPRAGSGRARRRAEHHAVEPTAEEALGDLENSPVTTRSRSAAEVYAQWRVTGRPVRTGVDRAPRRAGGRRAFGGYRFSLRASPFVPGEPAPLSRRSQQAGAGNGWSARSLAVGLAFPRPLRRSLLASHGVSLTPRGQLSRCGRGPDRPALRGSHGSVFYRSSASGSSDVSRSRRACQNPPGTQTGEAWRTAWRPGCRFSIPGSRSWRSRCRPNSHAARQSRSGSCETLAAENVLEAILSRRDKVAYEPPQRRWLDQPAFRRLIADMLLDASGARPWPARPKDSRAGLTGGNVARSRGSVASVQRRALAQTSGPGRDLAPIRSRIVRATRRGSGAP